MRFSNLLYRAEKRTWYLSIEDGKWKSTRGPDLIMERYFHACNSFTFNNELILAVVGGNSLSGSNFNEFLSYDLIDSQWNNLGAELDLSSDKNLNGQLLVSNGETLFYINTLENVFYRLEYTTFTEGFKWTKMNQTLENPRNFAVGVLIPDSLAICNNTAVEIKV